MSGGDLYAGGDFFTAGGTSASGIAKWDGSAWSALGTGISGTVDALAVSGDDLYAGGSFNTAGGTSAKYIAKWDGSAWSALGTGMNSSVYALAVSGGDLYAGGSFITAGGTSAKYIAKWNGSTWSALGTGMNNLVYALAADAGGQLYLGGGFLTAGTTFTPYIAQANLNGGAPEIAVSGNGQDIENGDDTPDAADHTDFGGTVVSGGSVARTFTITNSGRAVLNLTGAVPDHVTLTGSAAFSVTTQPASATVNAEGGTQTFAITFAPTTPGPHSAVVSIASDDADENPFTFTVAGVGTEPGSLSLSSAVYATSGGAMVNATVQRADGTAPVSVTLSTSDGSSGTVPPFAAALAGTDYEALSVAVDFAEGETSQVVPVTLIPRTGKLPNRRFTVALSAPTGGATLGAISSAEVRLLAPDTKAPTLAVRFPAATATLVTQVAPIVVSGTAGAALGLDRVEVALNGGEAVLADLGASSKPSAVPFTAPIVPVPGDNTLTVTAYDPSGNSTSVTRVFSFERRYLLTLVRQVPEMLEATPDKAGRLALKAANAKHASALSKGSPQTSQVLPGTQMAVTAAAKAGHLFSHWTGLPEAALVRGHVAAFPMPEADVSVTAVFVENPLTQGTMAALGPKPVFQGLLRPDETTPPGNDTMGFLSAAIVPAKGSLSGRLWMDGLVTAFTGALHADGSVWFKAGKEMASGLPFAGRELTMTWDESGLAMSVTRQVDEVQQVSEGQAKPPLYSKASRVRGALLDVKGKQGYYTVVLPAVPQSPAKLKAEYPQGAGHAGLTLLSNGTLKLAGTLAEGTKITAAAFLTDGDEADVFIVLPTPGGKLKAGSVLGTWVFDEAQTDSDVGSPDLVWFRPQAQTQASQVQAYRAGWPQGLVLGLIGAKYDKTATVQTTLGFAGPGRLVCSDGKLVAEVEMTNFSINGSKVTQTPSTDRSSSLSFTQSSGFFKGTFTPNWDSPAGKLPGFTGVLLSKGANRGGWGFFLSNRAGDLDPESGAVTLEQP